MSKTIKYRRTFASLAFPFLLIFLVFASVFTFTGCSDSNDQEQVEEAFPYTEDDCPVLTKNMNIYSIMKTFYYWYDLVPDVDYSNYSTPDALLQDLKYTPIDRWSFVGRKDELTSYFDEGKYMGLGFSVKYDPEDNLRIAYVYRDSPAGRAGLGRGDRILSINGYTIEEIESANLWEQTLGNNTPGAEFQLQVDIKNGSFRTITLQNGWVFINPVLHFEVINWQNMKVGYLVFNDFLDSARYDLDDVFSHFSTQAVDEVVIDLRYNTGGSGETARHLASLIGGGNVSGKVFAEYIHNDQFSEENTTEKFSNPFNAIDMERAIFLTTQMSCSASELVINSLKPFIDVIVIGGDTCGKPYGMYGYEICDLIFMPVEYNVVNSEGDGDYINGLKPDCYVTDNVFQSFGDIYESLLSNALFYLSNGYCESRTIRSMPGLLNGKHIRPSGLRREIGAF
jgi:hypothetical protein